MRLKSDVGHGWMGEEVSVRPENDAGRRTIPQVDWYDPDRRSVALQRRCGAVHARPPPLRVGDGHTAHLAREFHPAMSASRTVFVLEAQCWAGYSRLERLVGVRGVTGCRSSIVSCALRFFLGLFPSLAVTG
jgi:hypothetical protein